MEQLLYQPVTCPGSARELDDLLAAGVLVDLAGRALQRRPCRWCGATTLGETCPRSLPCPECRARPGSPCRRPSGHDAALHAGRRRAAEVADAGRQRRRDPDLPAPWARARAR